MPYATVGPVQERLDDLRTALGAEGIGLITVCRHWHGRAWPNAPRGFFPFRERIPGLIRKSAIGVLNRLTTLPSNLLLRTEQST
ncbi:MAG: hypothetical protein V4755_18295 [Curtobacterium sp.]